MSWAKETKLRLQIFGVFLLPIGIVALVIVGPQALRQWASRTWPEIAGQVQDVSFENSVDEKSREARYIGRVAYSYTVAVDRIRHWVDNNV